MQDSWTIPSCDVATRPESLAHEPSPGVPPSLPDAEYDALALEIDRKSDTFREAYVQWARLARDNSPLLAAELSLLTARLIREERPLLAAVTRRGAMVAALPLARRGRTLVALRSDHTPRVDAVGDPRATAALWQAVRRLDGWDTLELRGVPSDSPLALQLPELTRADGCRAYAREISRAPWFEVEGIEQRIHRRFRGDMRRLERQLGPIELERVASFDRRALNDLLRLEALGWKGEVGTAIACESRLVRFYAATARVFASRGQLTLGFLRAHGKRIAGCFALEGAGTFHLIKIAHDPAYAHFGPGQLLIRETAQDACRRGLTRYDLLGRDTAYKLKWTDRVRAHVELRIYRPSLRGRARQWTREVARPLAGRALRAVAAASASERGS
jgi:CelD/BcsL family acetyltransferase involved in cellulose biosynthesis